MPDSLLPKPIADERFLALEAVVEARIAALPMSRVWVYLLEHVEASALPHLARQFGALGPTWALTDEAGRRALLDRGLERRRHRGTPFAVRDALSSIGYEVEIRPSQPIRYDGSVRYNGQWLYAPTEHEYWILIESEALGEQEGDGILAAAREWGRFKATPVVFWVPSLAAELAEFRRHGGATELELMLLRSTPSDEATDVDITGAIQLVFDRDVQAGTGTIYLKRFSDDVTVDSWDVATDVVFTGATAELTLTDPLAVGTQYYIELESGVIQRLTGHAYAGLAKGDLDFTTEVNLEPLLLSSGPSDGATGAAAAGAIQLVFHRDVQAGTGTIYLKRFSDDVTVDSWDVATDVVFTGDTAELALTASLAEQTQHYLEIASGVIQRLTGHAYAGLAKGDLDFTTGDFAPLLLSSSPSDGATGVDTAVGIDLVFDQSVQAGVGAIYLKRFSDDVTVDSWDVTTDVVFTGDTAELTLSGELAGETQYYVEMASGVIEDPGGNAYAGLAKGDLDFTTEVLVIAALGTNTDDQFSISTASAVDRTVSHTLVAGSKRVMRIVVLARASTNDVPVFHSVTYGGVAAAQADTRSTALTRSAVYYVLESDLPADGARDIVVNVEFPGASGTLHVLGSAIENAAQSVDIQNGDALGLGTRSSQSVDVTGITDGAWAIGGHVRAAGSGGGNTTWVDQVEYFDSSASNTSLTAGELQSADGETSLGVSFASHFCQCCLSYVAFAPG